MADDDNGADEDDGPVVELGDGAPVEGMPLSRLTARLSWGMTESHLRERAGDTVIRTPDGPQRLGAVLDSIETVYFTRRQDLEDEFEAVVGTGPVPTTDGEVGDGSDDTDSEADGAATTNGSEA
jgi:hypothetical protein